MTSPPPPATHPLEKFPKNHPFLESRDFPYYANLILLLKGCTAGNCFTSTLDCFDVASLCVVYAFFWCVPYFRQSFTLVFSCEGLWSAPPPRYMFVWGLSLSVVKYQTPQTGKRLCWSFAIYWVSANISGPLSFCYVSICLFCIHYITTFVNNTWICLCVLFCLWTLQVAFRLDSGHTAVCVCRCIRR